MNNVKKYYIGDSCLAIQLSNKIDIEISQKILTLYKIIKENSLLKDLGVYDVVPSYNTLAIHFNSLDANQIELEIDSLLAENAGNLNQVKFNSFELEVDYNGEDLERVANLNNLSVEEVIDIHTKSDFSVAMIGFISYFPYLIGLDERLITPRLDKPRTKVPAGSVAIGAAQCAIYPKETPGGWNLIGLTDPNILKEIQPGDKIKFINKGLK